MSKEYLRKFKNRKVDYKKAVDTFFMSKGIACICCNVTGIGDIINNYSVPGYEMLNESLISYINGVMGNIPNDVPAVIEFCGCSFSDEEKKTIENAVWNHYEIELGKAQKTRRLQFLRFLWFAIFFIVSLTLILMGKAGTAYSELLYILFYFFGDTVIAYLFYEKKGTETERIRFAQLVTMKVIFREQFLDRDFTDEEVREILKDISTNAESTEI